MSISFNMDASKKTFKPIVPDGDTGFDEFGQLQTWVQNGEFRTGTFIRDVRAHGSLHLRTATYIVFSIYIKVARTDKRMYDYVRNNPAFKDEIADLKEPPSQ